jgi:hypothetical protein
MPSRDLLRALARLPAKLKRFACGLVALAVVTTTLLAGHTFFYCAAMARVGFDTCCAEQLGNHDEAHDEGGAKTLAIDETHRCCEAKTFAQGDPGRGAMAPPTVLASPVAAVLPAVLEALVHASRTSAPPRLRDTRAGPPPGSPLAFRVPVDVSLT